ncbi:MAG TPA: hypothetical protein PKZ92_00940 [Candidatus Woesebacteria bacterium]|jgi:hypothetical protein|nr:hypothetical protein [Candidatus Shapirobacteria bacterium]HOR01808.1 hypothetical protein [Candidatus Woesebacteria bacterium]
MDIKFIFLVISVIIGFITPIIGIRSVLKGGFKPQRMTRFLIFVISLLFVGTLLAQGDRNGVFIAIAQLIGSLIIFILSIKKGMGGTEKFDFFILFMVILSLIIWKTTNNPTLGLIMSIVTDLMSFLPSLIKTWKYPETEEWKFYMSDTLASFFSILSIKLYSLANLAFPIYIFLINTATVLIILGRKKRIGIKNPAKAGL